MRVRRKLVRRLACHSALLPRVGAADKLGAVYSAYREAVWVAECRLCRRVLLVFALVYFVAGCENIASSNKQFLETVDKSFHLGAGKSRSQPFSNLQPSLLYRLFKRSPFFGQPKADQTIVPIIGSPFEQIRFLEDRSALSNCGSGDVNCGGNFARSLAIARPKRCQQVILPQSKAMFA